MKKVKEQKGITLVALVVTIIVLLILAGVTITYVFSDNGIITQAQTAARETDIATTMEEIRTKLIEKQIANGGSYTNADVVEAIAAVTGNTVAEGDTETTTANGNAITISSLWVSSTTSSVATISTTESFVGYYADIDGDSTVDGVIFADLLIGGSGEWGDNWGDYEIETISSSKDYYISQESYEGVYGTKAVLSPTGSGNERFYVMALSNFTTGSYSTFYWYYNAYGNLDSDNNVSYSTNDFGKGKTNTAKWIDEWNSGTYGEQNARDLWGVIQEKVDEGWFIPSKSEWAAFGDAFSITSDNNSSTFGLSNYYWSSAQYDTGNAYSAYFDDGCMSNDGVNGTGCVRLAATF